MTIVVGAYDGEMFWNGDIYRVALTGSDGRVVAYGAWTVDYDTTYPNGPDCGPTCRRATTLTPRPQ